MGNGPLFGAWVIRMANSNGCADVTAAESARFQSPISAATRPVALNAVAKRLTRPLYNGGGTDVPQCLLSIRFGNASNDLPFVVGRRSRFLSGMLVHVRLMAV